MSEPMTPADLDALEAALTAANVTPDRPWDLYCAHGVADVLEHHTVFGGHSDEEYGPCRITTGDEFDEHASAELAVAAVNALPLLIAEIHDLRAARAVLTPTGLDVERLARALWQTMPMTPAYHSIGSWANAAKMVAAEYARLSDPETDQHG